ncbi:C40 family peptidase [Allosalinactinospora lopnorensis]|uniref:C40 family peptidase n=1 Tax=Allosalinactinospora lopnorensis TaxID=1352348 RepID=UPI00138F763A|nr:NlpC/P60 family protein [Allosalinactinospora lopnorensis]
MTQAAVTLSAVAAAAAFGIASAAPAAAKSAGPADSEPAEPVAVEETTQESSGSAASVVEHAQNQIGKPYRRGGAGPDAFDCSGLVQWVYKQVGKDLSRTTFDQINEARR